MKHFGLGPNGAIMILGLPVSFFFFFLEPTQVEDGASSRLVLCGLCGLNSYVDSSENLERFAMKF